MKYKTGHLLYQYNEQQSIVYKYKCKITEYKCCCSLQCQLSDLNTERLSDEAGTGGGQLEPVHLQPGVGAESQQFVFREDLSAGSSARVCPV